MVETINPSLSNPNADHFVSQEAANIYKLFKLSPSVPTNLKENASSPLRFLEGLIARNCHIDATEFLAHGLRDHLSLEWAHICICKRLKIDNQQEGILLQKIQDWLDKHDDTTRRLIEELGENIGFDNPLGWFAKAIFLSEGSMTPEENHETSPPPHVWRSMVSGAIILLVAQEPQNMEQSYKAVLDLGIKAALNGTLKEK